MLHSTRGIYTILYVTNDFCILHQVYLTHYYLIRQLRRALVVRKTTKVMKKEQKPIVREVCRRKLTLFLTLPVPAEGRLFVFAG